MPGDAKLLKDNKAFLNLAQLIRSVVEEDEINQETTRSSESLLSIR